LRSLCGIGTVPAAILTIFPCIDRKFFSAPRAYLLAVRFLHGTEITGTAAILLLIHAQRLPAAFAPQGLFLQRRICFPVVCPPLRPADVAAETALCAGTPFRLKVFSAVRADLNRRLIICLPLFLPFLIMVQLPAAFSAETPPAPGFTALLDWCSAFRAFVDRRVCVIPFCVVVPYTAFTAAEFLPRDVAGWNEALPTIQTGQFIRHDAIPLVRFFHLTTPGKVHDYLTLTMKSRMAGVLNLCFSIFKEFLLSAPFFRGLRWLNFRKIFHKVMGAGLLVFTSQ